jgi:copper transport protein
VVLQTPDFRPLAAKELTLILTHSGARIEPISRNAARSGDAWRVDDLMLPVSGTWSVEVDVLVSDFERLQLQGEIELTRDR